MKCNSENVAEMSDNCIRIFTVIALQGRGLTIKVLLYYILVKKTF